MGAQAGSTPSSSSSVSTPAQTPYSGFGGMVGSAVGAGIQGFNPGNGFGGMNAQSQANMKDMGATPTMGHMGMYGGNTDFFQNADPSLMQRAQYGMGYQPQQPPPGAFEQWQQETMAMQRMRRMGMPHPSQNTGFVPPQQQAPAPQSEQDEKLNQGFYSWGNRSV